MGGGGAPTPALLQGGTRQRCPNMVSMVLVAQGWYRPRQRHPHGVGRNRSRVMGVLVASGGPKQRLRQGWVPGVLGHCRREALGLYWQCRLGVAPIEETPTEGTPIEGTLRGLRAAESTQCHSEGGQAGATWGFWSTRRWPGSGCGEWGGHGGEGPCYFRKK